MAVVHNLLHLWHARLGIFLKVLITSQDSSGVGEVLWLVQRLKAGVKSEQVFVMVPFGLSAD